jgi:hypothetical protein
MGRAICIETPEDDTRYGKASSRGLGPDGDLTARYETWRTVTG